MSKIDGRLSKIEKATRPAGRRARWRQFAIFENSEEAPETFAGPDGRQYADDEISNYARAHPRVRVIEIHKDYRWPALDLDE